MPYSFWGIAAEMLLQSRSTPVPQYACNIAETTRSADVVYMTTNTLDG